MRGRKYNRKGETEGKKEESKTGKYEGRKEKKKGKNKTGKMKWRQQNRLIQAVDTPPAATRLLRSPGSTPHLLDVVDSHVATQS